MKRCAHARPWRFGAQGTQIVRARLEVVTLQWCAAGGAIRRYAGTRWGRWQSPATMNEKEPFR
jgi:hypothetical protein